MGKRKENYYKHRNNKGRFKPGHAARIRTEKGIFEANQSLCTERTKERIPVVEEEPRELTEEELQEIEREAERQKLKRKLGLLNVDMVGSLESRTLRIRPEPIVAPVQEKKPKIKRTSFEGTVTYADTLDTNSVSSDLEGDLVIDESQYEVEVKGAAEEPSRQNDKISDVQSDRPSKNKRRRLKKSTDPREAQPCRVKEEQKRRRPPGSKNQPGAPKKQQEKSSLAVEFERNRVHQVVTRVYDYLEREYEFLKTQICDKCDLSPLTNILKRTSIATGFTEKIVEKILKEQKEQRERLQKEAELQLKEQKELLAKRTAQRIRNKMLQEAKEKAASQNENVPKSVNSDNNVVSFVNNKNNVVSSVNNENNVSGVNNKNNVGSGVNNENSVGSGGNSGVTPVIEPVIETLKVEFFDDGYNDLGIDHIIDEEFCETDVTLTEFGMAPSVTAVAVPSTSQQWTPDVKLEPVDMDVSESIGAVTSTLQPPPIADPLGSDPIGKDPTGPGPTGTDTKIDPLEIELQETNSAVQNLQALLS